MAMIRDGKVYRNIQEQVGKNKEDIEALQAKAAETYKSIIVEDEPENPEEKVYYLDQVDDTLIPFVWDAENEEWLMVGANPDLSNYVTLDGEQEITGIKTIANDKELRFGSNAGDGKYFYIKNNANQLHVGAVGLATSLTLDSYLTNFSPLRTNEQNLGTSSLFWNMAYISGIKTGNIQASGSAITLYGNIEPNTNEGQKLGSTTKRFESIYTKKIADGNVSVKVEDIATKSDPSQPILVGSFNSSGTIDVAASTLPDGVYMFTYAYAQGIAYVNNTQITTATGYGTPIRADIPVVYSGYPTWEARPGNLRISKAADEHYLIQVSDGTHNAYEGAELYAIRINII